MYQTQRDPHHPAAASEEENDEMPPPHAVIMMPGTPSQSILKPKSNAFWTKKRIVCVVMAILVLIGCGAGAIWYFYPREKESTTTSSSSHAKQRKVEEDAEERRRKGEKTVLRFGGVTNDPDEFCVVNMNFAPTSHESRKVDAIIGDFNNEEQMNQMAEAFPQKFHVIMFDGNAAQKFDGNENILKSIKQMLKPNGLFIYEMKRGDDIDAIKETLECIGFMVTYNNSFSYEGWTDRVGRWRIVGKQKRYNVMICRKRM